MDTTEPSFTHRKNCGPNMLVQSPSDVRPLSSAERFYSLCQVANEKNICCMFVHMVYSN